MQHNNDTSVLIIANAHPSDTSIPVKKDTYEARQYLPDNTSCQPSTGSPHSVLGTGYQPETQKSLSGFPSSPQTLPLWRFCSMADKGLSAKRVEDVKMNRIDKLRAGRKRRASRRPFVFKSSPLAEGQGAGRLTQFQSNTFPNLSSNIPSLLACSNRAERMELHQATFYSGGNAVRISRFSDPSNPSAKHWLSDSHVQKPITFSSLDRNSNGFPSWSQQPQISRLCNPQATKLPSPFVQSKSDYQSWEISLPKCAFPPMGLFSN
ncbi:hypothetical protein MJO28_015348 [Puccinia striiformis f. sp. tritici]|nr:hypothetical protein MJO29_015088 [Puccinia striiformis f. sp. tritici]KAI7938428.1 hypothetical protein MJO28_015348 [Puccinia striiformis f. sp. tritici]